MSAITDPIADLLTRIRNAHQAGHKMVSVPSSNIKKDIVRILHEEAYIKDYRVVKGEVQDEIKIVLKYDHDGKPVIHGLKRISKPGLRKYADVEHLPRVYNNLGIAILTTSKGVITNKTARREKVGGEILCHIW